MINQNLNPFRPTRWEHHGDGRPLIWFTSSADELASEKPAYVYGSRGSGKTSLLKSICWEDLCHNESLQLQRQLSDFPYVGIYIRFPDHISGSMSYDGWESIFPNSPDLEYEYYRFFSLAVELICCERALSSCHELRILEKVAYLPKQELEIVELFLDEYSDFLKFSTNNPKTFVQLARTLRNVVRRMNEACSRGTVGEIVRQLPPREPNQVLAYLVEKITNKVSVNTPSKKGTTRFKFCFDDCEVLNTLQRKSLNSLVRLSRFPISWVISSVGSSHDDSATFIDSQPLTDADRRIVSLDDRKKTDFRQFCQSVVSLRLLFSIPESERNKVNLTKVSNFFDLDERLGSRDVNDMMGIIVKRSTSQEAKRLTRAAKILLEVIEKNAPKSAQKYSVKDGKLPFYETYLLLHWREEEESFQTSFGEDDIDKIPKYGHKLNDPAFNAWLRRKQQGALLHFAASSGVKSLPLSGANVIISLADGSIRDFLEIMGEVFEAYVTDRKWNIKDPLNLSRFATSRTAIAGSTQTKGIHSASETYETGISHRSEIAADTVQKLIDGLGYYTSILQSNPADPQVFASAERGIFILEYQSSPKGGIPDQDKIIQEIFRQAELSGYLRLVPLPKQANKQNQLLDPTKAIAFRLHRRFSPYFKFSFRGAYQVVKLTPQDVSSLCLQSDNQGAFSWAKNMAGISSVTEEPQMPLPFFGQELNE